jgi:hypothetical protein
MTEYVSLSATEGEALNLDEVGCTKGLSDRFNYPSITRFKWLPSGLASGGAELDGELGGAVRGHLDIRGP